jgi:hypothetical protein
MAPIREGRITAFVSVTLCGVVEIEVGSDNSTMESKLVNYLPQVPAIVLMSKDFDVKGGQETLAPVALQHISDAFAEHCRHMANLVAAPLGAVPPLSPDDPSN